MLKLNRSSYYKWKSTAFTREKRLLSDAILGARVKTVFTTHSGCYGAKRIAAELKDQVGHDPANHKRVARIMRSLKLFGYTKKRKVTTTVSDKTKTVFPDLVGRKFTADKPNQLLTSEISPICQFRMGRICTELTVIDCYSRRLVGFSITDHMRDVLGPGRAAHGQRPAWKPQGRDFLNIRVYGSHTFVSLGASDGAGESQ